MSVGKRISLKTLYNSIDITDYFNNQITDKNYPDLKRQISDYISNNLIKSYVKLEKLDTNTYIITFVNGVKLKLSYSNTYICTCKRNQSNGDFVNTCYCVFIDSQYLFSKLTEIERRILKAIYGLAMPSYNIGYTKEIYELTIPSNYNFNGLNIPSDSTKYIIPLYFIPVSTPQQISKFTKAYNFNAKSKLLHTGEIAYLENNSDYLESNNSDYLVYFLNEDTTHAIIPSYVNGGIKNCLTLGGIGVNFRVTKLTIKTNTLANVNFDFSELEELDIQGNIFNTGTNNYFSFSPKLKRLTLGDKIKNIPNYAFKDCENLRYVKLPSNLKTIGKGAFAFCRSLGNIEFPDTLEDIGNEAFQGIAGNQNIKFRNLKTIGKIAFADNQNLENVELPRTIQTVGYGAFAGCSKLQRIKLPITTKLDGEIVEEGVELEVY